MESQDLFFSSGDVFLRVSVSNVSGLETLNTVLQRNGLAKFLQFNDYLFVAFAGKKQPNQDEKMSEIWKKFYLKVMATSFKKIMPNPWMFKSRKFWWSIGLVSKFYLSLDYITGTTSNWRV